MVQIVAAGAEHKAQWWPLWQAYLTFYNHSLLDEVSDLTFARCLDPAAPMALHLAVDDDAVIGFAVVVYHPSSWARVGYAYLEDLFVDESARGKGAGRALIEAAAAAAKALDYERLYWVTHADNVTARALYDRVARKNDLVTYVRDI